MRSAGQTRSDLMTLRALISNGVSTTVGRLDALESSLSPVAISGSYSDLTDTPTLSAVATSGAYSDLSGRPTLGALAARDAVTHLDVSDWDSATASFLTEHQSLADYAKTADLSDLAFQNTITHGLVSDWDSATSPFLTETTSSSAVPISCPEVTQINSLTLSCRRFGKIVSIGINISLSGAVSTEAVVATGLPPPAETLYDIIDSWANSFRRPIRVGITTSGEMTILYGQATSYAHLLTYVAA